MRITYLEHSGYMLEEGDIVLIFDYYKGQLPEVSEDKKIYVFASHRHPDHFQACIFEWARQYPDIRYVLSDDIQSVIKKDQKVQKLSDQIIYIGPRREIQIDALQVRTLRSTDEGVAFLVRLPETHKVIYHAGDLNWWHWEEEDADYNENMRRTYQCEIDRMEGEHIDVAFVPLDPRLDEQYYWGMDYFMKHTDTRCVFPMHMWGKYDICNRLKQEKEAEAYRDRVRFVSGPGEVFDI